MRMLCAQARCRLGLALAAIASRGDCMCAPQQPQAVAWPPSDAVPVRALAPAPSGPATSPGAGSCNHSFTFEHAAPQADAPGAPAKRARVDLADGPLPWPPANSRPVVQPGAPAPPPARRHSPASAADNPSAAIARGRVAWAQRTGPPLAAGGPPALQPAFPLPALQLEPWLPLGAPFALAAPPPALAVPALPWGAWYGGGAAHEQQRAAPAPVPAVAVRDLLRQAVAVRRAAASSGEAAAPPRAREEARRPIARSGAPPAAIGSATSAFRPARAAVATSESSVGTSHSASPHQPGSPRREPLQRHDAPSVLRPHALRPVSAAGRPRPQLPTAADGPEEAAGRNGSAFAARC